MKKLLLALLLFSGLAFGQGGASIGGSNLDFEAFTGTEDDNTTDSWTGWTLANAVSPAYIDASTNVDATYGGTYSISLQPSSPFAPRMQRNLTAVAETEYIISFMYRYSNATNASNYRVYDADNAADLIAATALPATTTWTRFDSVFTTASGNTDVLVQWGLTSNASTKHWFDDINVRLKLDTLYIADTGGNDSNSGLKSAPIKTISEALARGQYNGGVFAFKAGDTFDETFTVTNNNIKLTVYDGTARTFITTIDSGAFSGFAKSKFINPNPLAVRTPVLQDQITATQNGDWDMFAGTSFRANAIPFIPSLTGSADSIVVSLKKQGSATQDVQASLWNNNDAAAETPSEAPTSPVYTSNNTLDASTLTTSYVATPFTFDGFSTITSGDTMWVGLRVPVAQIDASNYVKWRRHSQTSYHDIAYGNLSWVANGLWSADVEVYTIQFIIPDGDDGQQSGFKRTKKYKQYKRY